MSTKSAKQKPNGKHEPVHDEDTPHLRAAMRRPTSAHSKDSSAKRRRSWRATTKTGRGSANSPTKPTHTTATRSCKSGPKRLTSPSTADGVEPT